VAELDDEIDQFCAFYDIRKKLMHDLIVMIREFLIDYQDSTKEEAVAFSASALCDCSTEGWSAVPNPTALRKTADCCTYVYRKASDCCTYVYRWITPFDCESVLRNVLPNLRNLHSFQASQKVNLFCLKELIAVIGKGESASAKAYAKQITEQIGVYREKIIDTKTKSDLIKSLFVCIEVKCTSN